MKQNMSDKERMKNILNSTFGVCKTSLFNEEILYMLNFVGENFEYIDTDNI